MPKLIIDNRQVEVEQGCTILDAAGRLGIEIPTMCFLKGYKASTSCMLCIVKVEGVDGLVPACGTIAQEGMVVESDSEEIRQVRKAALELLLSDHVGDCVGPCQVACPAHMNIPLMIRQIGAGKIGEAIATIKRNIALPAVLGRICPGPCEKVCRRAAVDQPISICLLKRYAADADLELVKTYLPVVRDSRGKNIAIVGGGPAGLAAAYYLLQDGYSCTIFDDHDKLGGMLRYGVSREALAEEALDKEIDSILKLGADFKGGTRIGDEVSLQTLQKDFDAVFVSTGTIESESCDQLGLENDSGIIKIDKRTYQTSVEGVFAGGDVTGRRRLAVRAVADGREAAIAIGQYLGGEQVTGAIKAFNSRIGKMTTEELEVFLAGANRDARVEARDKGGGFDAEQGQSEAARCLHCDCRKPDSCKLREYAQEYGAKAGRYKGERRAFVQQTEHPEIVYEVGKCIDCGLCIQIAATAGEELGLAFIGRGFDVRVAVPFDRTVAEGLNKVAGKCAEACPTGALAQKEKSGI